MVRLVPCWSVGVHRHGGAVRPQRTAHWGLRRGMKIAHTRLAWSAGFVALRNSMSTSLSRRQLLQGAAGIGAAQLALHTGLSHAQAKSISATTYPGAWESAHRAILLPAFAKATGASTNLVSSLAVDTVSKVVASKANPPFDVIILDEGPYLAALSQDIFEKIPGDKMPNLKDVPSKLVDPRGLGVFVSGQIIGIAYNTEKIKNPPRSWNDLLKPEYKGRVGLAGMGSTLMSAWMGRDRAPQRRQRGEPRAGLRLRQEAAAQRERGGQQPGLARHAVPAGADRHLGALQQQRGRPAG
jgi:hypothetical protein